MKKLNYLFLGLAGLAMVSCSQEEVSSPAINGEGNVHFKVNLPKDLGTRAAISSGLDATQLYALAYETSTEDPTSNTYLFTAKATFADNELETTVNMSLVPNKSYNIVFFAAAPSVSQVLEPSGTDSSSTAVYSINASTGALTVNYDEMKAPGEATQDIYDCFYATKTIKMGTSALSADVDLNRPIAQVNWGSTPVTDTNSNYGDVFGENGKYLATTFTATNVPNTLDMFTGEVSVEGKNGSDTNEVTFTNFAPPTGTYPTIGTGDPSYKYLAMQYLLAPEATSLTLDLTLTITNKGGDNTSGDYSNEIPVSSAPIQANYQTNIYGNLLAPEATFTVNKIPGWATGSPNNVSLWDGSTTSKPAYDEATDTYTINNAGEWVWLTKNISSNPSYTGMINATVNLNADLDFAGQPVQGVYFAGTFNGNGHTLKNFTIIPKSSYAAGFFGNDISAGGDIVVNDLTFDNVTVDNSSNSEGWAAVVIADIQTNNFTLNNVTVKNSNIKGVKNVGGLVGFVSGAGDTTPARSVTINNCTVDGCTIENVPVMDESGFVGGMIGRVVGSATFGTGNTVENTTINGYWVARKGKDSISKVASGSGPITGIENVTITDVDLTATEVTELINVDGEGSYSTLEEALKAAPTGSTINLGWDTYEIPVDFSSEKELTFVGLGADYSIIQIPHKYNLTPGAVLTFKNLTLQAYPVNGSSMMFTESESETFNNVQFIGEFHAYGGTSTFTNCVFNQNDQLNLESGRYGLWIECRTPGTTTVTDCTFNNFLAKGILVYDNASNSTNLSTMGDINVTNCTFTATAPYKKNAAIEIHTENFAKAGTLTITDVTYNDNYSAVYQQKNNNTGDTTNFYEVIVNGVVKQNGGQTNPPQTDGGETQD